jgi:hypothetical protein
MDETNTNVTAQPANVSIVERTPANSLPANIQQALSKYTLKERAGVAPTWEPKNPGEFILGSVVAVRAGVGKYQGTVMVLDTPTGFQSVWLGADLSLKLPNVVEGMNLVIQFEGWLEQKDQPKLANRMRQFKVIEVMK